MVHEAGSTVKAALDLAGRGWAVFPIKPNDKTPATKHGFKDASTEPAVVEKLFAKRSGCNVGIATGPASGLWVLDLDGPEGIKALDELERQHGKLPETVSAITGGGGRHLYFTCNGTEVKNRTKIREVPIDVRGAGGYVVVPPSIHPSGRRYEWERSPDSTPIATAPEWLLKLVSNSDNSTVSNSSGKPVPLTFTVSGGTVEDLATAPGARGPTGPGDKGNRHDTALRLIGSAIGRGGDLCEVARQAVEWGRRCSPPMSDDEVLKIVSDLSQKQGTRIEAAVRDEVEAAPLPEPVPWPILDKDAYQGLTGEVVRKIEPETEADPVAILIQLLVMAGNLVGRLAHYVVEGTFHHANLFAVLVGSTARGRKGTSEGRVRQLLRFVDERWNLDNIKTGLVSGEGLVWNVRDPIYKVENVKEKGKVVGTEEVLSDPGIDDKRLLVIEQEFAAVLRVCRRETNTLSPTLRSAWDSGILRTLAKNSPAKATDAHISIIGHITQEELRRALAEVDGFNGFSNRFLWVAVRRSKLLPDGGQDLDLSTYAERLALAVERARSVERLRRDEQAAALWRQTYAELADDDSAGLLAAVTSRAEAQVLRLSMIYALLDGSGMILEQHLRAALAVWRYCRHSARLIFGDAGGDPLLDMVLNLVCRTPGISRRDIHRATGNHVKAEVLVLTLARLRDAGKIRAETTPAPGAGRPTERWYPCEQCELCELIPTAQQPHNPQGGNSSQSSQSSQGEPAKGSTGGMEVVVL
jgi:hypothetical protein